MNLTDKQINIIDKSIELIAAKGIQGFTIKNLSAKLKVSEGAIYRHFKSKTDILLAILKSFQNESSIILNRACNSENSAFEDIDRIFLHHFSFFAKKPAVAAVIFSESIFQNDHLLSKEVFKLLNMHEEALKCIISKGQKSNEINTRGISNVQIVRIIIGSIRYTVTKWRLEKYKFDIETEGMVLLNSIKELLKK